MEYEVASQLDTRWGLIIMMVWGMMLKDPKHLMIPGTSLMMCPAVSEDVCAQQKHQNLTSPKPLNSNVLYTLF